MASGATEQTGVEGHPAANGPLPEFIDWILGAIIALTGLVAIIGGSAAAFLVDREMIAQDIEEGAMEVTVLTAELTEAEMTDVAVAVVTWTGAGLLVAGLGMLIFGIGYIAIRHRQHQRARAGEPVQSYWAHVVLGGVATAILSFIPFSPAVGGALAGYLERGESDRIVSVGAIAGLLPVIPLLVMIAFVFGGLVVGMYGVDQGGMAIFLGMTMLFAVLLLATVGAGLGAIGGYVGGKFAESRAAAT